MSTNPITTRLREDTDYRKFFKSTMRMFGVNSPKELSGDKKKEFFNYVDKNYTAKNENKLRESFFPTHSTDSRDLKNTKAALANWFNNIKSGKVSPQSALQTQQLNILSDLIEEYAEAYAGDAINYEN